jgi:hypothetical protein
MALTLTVLNEPAGYDYSQRRTYLYGTGVFSGNYTAGGEAVNWGTLAQADGVKALINSRSTTPLAVSFTMQTPASGTPSYAYLALYNATTGNVQVYGAPATSAEGTGFEELAGGTAYPADVTGATFAWKAEFLAE